MNDTSMLRVRTDLKNRLKVMADKEGRTLEWLTNKMVLDYLNDDVEGHYSLDLTKGSSVATILPTTMPRNLSEANDPNHSGYSAHIAPDLGSMERACCLGKIPCKHWSFNSDQQVYVNSLSGRVKQLDEG